MSNHRKLEPSGADSWNYIVVLDDRSRAIGKLRHCADSSIPVWSWLIAVKDAPFANGLACQAPKPQSSWPGRVTPPSCATGDREGKTGVEAFPLSPIAHPRHAAAAITAATRQ
jgi:hypothetical protein